MKKTTLYATILAGLAAAMLSAAPASAQATRTWVSGVGDDVNPCSRTAPCKTFAGAISKTAAAGEINVLDPGGFGAVTITKSITIRSDHIEAGISAASVNGVIVNAGATDRVVLEGLDIDGFKTGINGVRILAGQQVYVIRCSIRGFTGNGVDMASSSANARVIIRNSFINNNAGGVNVAAANNIATIVNTEIDANTSFSIQGNAAGVIIGYANSVFNASPTAINMLAGSQAFSFGPSSVVSGAINGTVTNSAFK